MHLRKAAPIACGKAHVTAGVMLLSLLAAGAAGAQTWKSHASTDAPDMLYRQHCVVCHGENGDGKTQAAEVLEPPPKDFTSQKTRNESSRAHIITVLNKGARTKDGKPTAMIAWKNHLSPEQIETLADYVIVRFMDGKVPMTEPLQAGGHQHKGHDHSGVSVKAVDYPYGLKPDAARGKSVYTAQCAACHGEQGDGRGNPARVGTSKPRNFHDAGFRDGANGFSLFSAVAHGRGHANAWAKPLSNQEIADASEYVLRTFVQPGKTDSHEHHADAHGGHGDAHGNHAVSHGKKGSK